MKNCNDENSKEKILNAATRLFALKGYDGASIREICKEAGVNICMISYYFGGKKELYQGIIDNIVGFQNDYMQSFLNFEENFSGKSKSELIEKLLFILDKFINFFYSNISNDLITFLIKEQQHADFNVKPPSLVYLRRLVAAILNKDINDKEVVFKTLFIISQINSPRILPMFSLRLLGQKEFTQEDIRIIKDNVKMYVKATFGGIND